MKCISCETEINPQWKHAIDMNVCPFCGKTIVEEHLKNLLSTLRETMDALQTYPAELNDWMLSNYSFIKTDSPDIGKYMPSDMLQELKKMEEEKDFLKRKDAQNQKFTVKVQTEAGEEEVVAEKIQSEDRTNSFFKRAEVIKPASGNQSASQTSNSQAFQSPAEKTQHLKKVAQQIKREGAQGVNISGVAMALPAEMLEQADPEAVAEYESLMSGNEVGSSLNGGSEDDVPMHILAANQAIAARKGNTSSHNAADLLKLQQMQERVKQSRENFESGENRGSKGGGFSRA